MRRRGPPLVTESSQSFSFTRRALVFGGVQAAVGALLAGRMGYIAIAESDRYQLMAEENRIQMRLIPPRRGWILDRHGHPMAVNRSDFRVDIIPDRLEDEERVLAELTRLLDLEADDVERIREEIDQAAGYQPVPVAERLSFEKYAAVTVRLPQLPGVAPLRAFSRYYPEGAAVGHLIGYVGTPSREEYEAEDKNRLLITPGFKIGKEGLEEVMEQQLRGTPGAGRVEVSARGRLVRELRTVPDKSGAPLQTTIDAGLQTYAARRLGEESGAVVVLDCSNGDILALASMPAYDPNEFSDGISHSEWNMMAKDERRPLVNKVLNSLYPPGSTFKPTMAMALLAAGVDPAETVYCPGGYQLGRRFFRCLGRHGSMNMHTAVARSCNTYFYAMGRRIGIEGIAETARRLGFGAKFELPVVSQSYGTVPDAAWKLRRYEQKWTEADTLNTSIGQGYLIVNPLQLAVSSARIASGRPVVPNLLGRDHPAPPPFPNPPEHFEIVRQAMSEVVNGRGTAGRSRLPFDDILMGGKTGTAQVVNLSAGRGGMGVPWKYRDHGLFVCFAPVHAPRYAAAVVIEHGMGGSRAAAPVARDVLTYLFDKDKAMAALLPLERQWGGNIAERMERRAREWAAARAADSEAGG